MISPRQQGDKKPSVLSYPGFRNLWLGQLVSQFGDVLHFLVFLWLVYAVTGDPAAVGVVSACSVGTYIALSMYAGTVADRYDRRTILIWSDILCALVVFALVAIVIFIPKPPLWLLCAFAVLLKAAFVFQRPARSAAIPRLVPPGRLLEANSINSTVQTAMPLAGNALGAILLGAIFRLSATVAYVFTFTLNGITFLASAAFMSRLPPIVPERDRPAKHAWHEAIEGARFILTHPVLRTAALLFVGFEFFVGPFMPAYVVLANKRFHAGPELLALLDTGFFGGFVLGSYIHYRRPIYRPGFAFSLFMFLAALAIVPMGYVHSVPLLWSLNLVCGLFFPFAVIPLETFMQAEPPDEFRGRVNAAVGAFGASAAPLGMLLSGFLINLLGLGGIFAFMGLGLALSSLCGLLSPSFRNSRLAGEWAEKPQPSQGPLPEALTSGS